MLWDVQIPNSELSVDICISALHCIALLCTGSRSVVRIGQI